MTPDFDELVGRELEPGERERLRRVHELLVTAGPPAELPPEIESGPTLAMSLGRPPAQHRFGRRALLVAAAAVVILLAFLAGYITGNNDGGGGTAMALRGTELAPSASGRLNIEPADEAGNWPMRLAARGLPKLPPEGYYIVFLVRDGKLFAPCGGFLTAGKKQAISVRLNAPYEFEAGDSWVVTEHLPGSEGAGPVVLEPVRT